MFRWMGGSRRKVTTSRQSRQSIEKRQKQYFEQRKRQQQQQHNSRGLESYSDKKVTSTQCHENNRSLDILNLLSLSKNAQDCTSRFPEGRGTSKNEHATPNYQPARCPNTVQMETKNLCPSEQVEIREPRIASTHLDEKVRPQQFTYDLSSSSHHDVSKGNNDNDPMKINTNHKFSVFDMLDDDGQNSSSKRNLVHENHVAFSVEGLGKVEMETPVHSPQRPTRNFSYGFHAPPKFCKGTHSSKNFNCGLEDQFPELDDMAVGADIPTSASSLDFPPYLGEPRCNAKRKITLGKERLLHDTEDVLSNDEFYDYREEQQDRYKWHEKSSFLKDNFVDDDCGSSWKNWSHDLESDMMNDMRSWKCENPDFSFEGLHTQKKRATAKAAGCFNVSAWPCFGTEDARDRLSFLSEDSCFSDAVWCEGTKNPSFNSERQKFKGCEADFRSPLPLNKFSTKKEKFTPEFRTKGLNTWQQEGGICSRQRNRMSDFSTPGDDWLFED